MTLPKPQQPVGNENDEIEDNSAGPVRRSLHLVVILILLEAAAYATGRMAPAMAGLMRPVYVGLVIGFAFPIWNAARRRRTGQDRRHGDRRDRQTSR